jgi:hypothetical protein
MLRVAYLATDEGMPPRCDISGSFRMMALVDQTIMSPLE